MTDFWMMDFVKTKIEHLAIIAIILGLYYLYYYVRHHGKMRLVEHSFYLALWLFEIVSIIVLIVFSFIPIENINNPARMMHYISFGIGICGCIILEPIRARKAKAKANFFRQEG